MTSACVERFINISKQFSVDSNLKKIAHDELI